MNGPYTATESVICVQTWRLVSGSASSVIVVKQVPINVKVQCLRLSLTELGYCAVLLTLHIQDDRPTEREYSLGV